MAQRVDGHTAHGVVNAGLACGGNPRSIFKLAVEKGAAEFVLPVSTAVLKYPQSLQVCRSTADLSGISSSVSATRI
jgi:hypothetical protein